MFFKVKASLAIVMLGAATCSVSQAQESRQRYLVYLNPFVVQQQELQEQEKARAQGMSAPQAQAPVVLNEREKSRYLVRQWERQQASPAVEAVKDNVLKLVSSAKRGSARGYAGSSTQNSPLIPAFYAYLDKNDVEVIKNSGYAVSVDPVDTGKSNFVFSSYYDQNIGGEIIPWGKQAVNANDSISTNNPFYVVDAKFNNNALANEINFSYTNTSERSENKNHPAHVVSLAAAKMNSSKIRGINPGQPVAYFGTDLNRYAIADNIHNAASFSEWNNHFATLSFSINYNVNNQLENPINHNAIVGRALRRASARLFVAQSAGNFDKDACLNAYNYNAAPEYNDGIMVVGGTNRFGQRYTATTNPAIWSSEDKITNVGGSNFGACVEAWAPAHEMTSTLHDGTVATITGTSFAAPIVAALAGRYGDQSTRPLEREAYIRASLSPTGSYEAAPGSNRPIQLARYTAPWQHNIPRRLPVSAVYSRTSTANLNRLVDGKFYDGIFWNANANWGSVVLDLGYPRDLTGIRMMIRSSADGGQINFAVHGGNTLAPGGTTIAPNPIAYWNFFDQYDLIPYYIALSGKHRYVMLEGNNFNSWLAYSEIEVYGR